jgi:O-methyltransferase involved in polyketide biosynthesis
VSARALEDSPLAPASSVSESWASAARELSGVSRTLLIPLLARARAESLWPGSGFRDPIARDLIERLAVTPEQISRDRFPMRLCISRSLALQQQLQKLLTEPIDRRLVLLACGLDTLPYRLDSGLATKTQPHSRAWICADLPAVIAVRERLLPATAGVSHLSVRLPDDLGALVAHLDATRPVFILEGVLPYLMPAQVRRCLDALVDIAPAGADLLLDSYHPTLLAFSRLSNTFRRLRTAFHFGLKDPRAYAEMNTRIRFKQQHDLLQSMPWRLRKRTLLPSLAANGKPLASLVHLEIVPEASRNKSNKERNR